ncbi:dynein heavy chain, partial [Kipferlia bialata]
ISEVHYGGRVTDDYDRRLMCTYAEEWIHPRALQDEFQFYTGYRIPKHSNIQEARDAIEQLPMRDNPQIYALHANAELTFQAKQATDVLGTILAVQPKDASSGNEESPEAYVFKQAKELLSKLPPDYDTKFTVPSQIKKQGGKAKPLNVFLSQ